MTNNKLIDDILTRGVELVLPSKELLYKKLLFGEKLNVYVGVDATGNRVHLGHIVSLRKLQKFADLGHHVTFVIGDFTAIIGDTSDKNSERPVLTKEVIEENFRTYKEQTSKILDYSKVEIRYNSEWLSKLSLDELLRIASKFSVNDFIGRELIKKRLSSGDRVSIPEMIYPLMQGYDSYYLDTDVQIGGTDQIFNMQAGRTLLSVLNNKDSYTISSRFLTGTDGRKMSKSWGNAIWLTDSPREVYGKVMSIRDDLIVEYFELATSMDLDEIAKINEKLIISNPFEAKKILARRIVSELNGEDFVESAEEYFVSTVQNKTATDDVLIVETDLRSINFDGLLEFFLEHKLIKSKSEGRRLKDQGGIYLNNEVFVGNSIEITGDIMIRLGKRRYIKLVSK